VPIDSQISRLRLDTLQGTGVEQGTFRFCFKALYEEVEDPASKPKRMLHMVGAPRLKTLAVRQVQPLQETPAKKPGRMFEGAGVEVCNPGLVHLREVKIEPLRVQKYGVHSGIEAVNIGRSE
jgi:hypothetical protein